MNRNEANQQALSNARSNQSILNYPSIYSEFMARGIPESQIEPRVNVFTYKAWLALGRQVRKGEHGVRVVTFVPMTKTDKLTGKESSFRRPWSTTVFHISQTDAVQGVQS